MLNHDVYDDNIGLIQAVRAEYQDGESKIVEKVEKRNSHDHS
ncbi:hypothetical protein [Nostoc sp. ChiQUE01b]|nr:hypothetical protein [Nostoc sp. ChiQUE01b]